MTAASSLHVARAHPRRSAGLAALLLVLGVLVPLRAALLGSAAAPSVTVTSTGDAVDLSAGDGVCDTDGSGTCTLRAAIQEANASTVDTINFAIPPADGSVVTIPLGSVLPTISSSVTIDGSTQPGWVDEPIVALDGSATSGDVFDITGNGTELRSLVLHDAGDEAVNVRADDVTITASWIGLLPDGTTAAGSGDDAIAVRGGADRVTIGGLAAGDGNVIAAADGDALYVLGDDAVIAGNRIGTAADGATARGASRDGIRLDGAIGALVTGNTIAHHGGAGVALVGAADDAAVLDNRIHSNAGLGIDLDDDGVTANDPLDADGGTNHLLNTPEPTVTTDTYVTFDLDVPAGDHRIEVFRNPTDGADPSGSGEGEQLVGATTITHPGTGPASFTVSGLTGVEAYDVISLTTTEDLGGGSFGSTSEFSATALADDHLGVVNDTGDAPDLVAGDDVCDTGGTNADGDPACTLRAAIQEANASAVVDTVHFDVPTGDAGYVAADGLWTIDVGATALPAVTGAGTTIDGSTQPGYASNGLVGTGGTVGASADAFAQVRQPAIALDNSGNGGASIGLDVDADDVTLRGLGVWRFPDAVAGGAANVVLRSGTGLVVEDVVVGADPTDPVTTPAGSVATEGHNVALYTAANGTVRDSIIAWGGGGAVRSEQPASDGWTLSGLEVRGHGANDPGAALHLAGGSGHRVTGNLVVDNSGGGVSDAPGGGTDVEVSGSTVTGNGGAGIDVHGSTSRVTDDVVSGNGGNGVTVQPGATDVAITANSTTGNGGLGIDLGDDGVTANDAGDGDTGANELLNRPVLTSASTTRVTVELDVPAGDVLLELVTNPTDGADASGAGEGELLVHQETVTHPGGGATSFVLAVPGLAAGDELSATATEDLGGGAYGSTSEFADTVVVAASSTLVVNDTGDAADAAPGDGVCDTGADNADGHPACTLRAAIQEANASTNDTATFAVPSGDAGVDADGVVSIGPATALPAITAGLTIDGSTQPGWVDAPIVALDGAAATGDLLDVAGAGTELRWLVLHDAADEAVNVRAADVTIVASWIGLLPDGSTPAGSGDHAVAVRAGADRVTIGGPGAADGNVIAAAGGDLLYLLGDDAEVEGNLLGTDAAGTGPRGAVRDGVRVDGATGVLVTGTTIAFNGGDGVAVVNGADDVAVLDTSLHDNGGLGIDLADDGVTANDAGDGDTGPNGRYNRPVITGINEAGGTVTVDVTLDVPAGDVLLEAFTSPLPDPSGAGEGTTRVATAAVTHTGSGAEAFQLTFAGDGTETITVTATEDLGGGAYGATSEFSAAATTPTANDDPGDVPTLVVGHAPLSYWPLGEASGTTAIDAGSLGNDGSYTAGPTLGADGALVGDDDTAVAFDGTDDVLVAPHDPAYLLDAGTISMWVDLDDLDSVQVPFSKDATGTGDGGHAGLRIATDGTVVYRQHTSGGDVEVASPAGAVTAGAWHHLAFGFGGRGLELYVDGERVDTDPDTGGWGVSSGGTGNTEPITIGASGATSTAGSATPISRPVDGRIDEVAVFGTQLTPAQVRELAAAATQHLEVEAGETLSVPVGDGVLANDHDPEGDALTATLVSGPSGAAGFTLDPDGSFTYTAVPGFVGTDTFTYTATDGSDTSAPATVTVTVLPGSGERIVDDSTGNGHDGRPSGGMTTADQVDGRIGGALDLDGADDRVVVDNLDVAGDQLTLSAWVDPDTYGTDPVVLAKAVGLADADVQWRLLLDDDTATTASAAGSVRTGSGLATATDAGSTDVADGWVHLVLTHDGSQVVLWRDGVAVATAAHSGALQPDPAVPVVLGGGTETGGQPLDGRLDEVRVSHTRRSDAWIAATHATQDAPGSAVSLGSTQTAASAGWTTTTAQARSGSSSVQAPADVFRSWLTLDGVDETGLEATAWWRVNTLADLDLGQGVRAGDAAGAGPIRQDEAGLFDATGFDLGQVDGTRSQLVAPPAGQTPAADTWQQVTVRIDQLDGLSATADGADVPASGDTSAGAAASGTFGLRVGMLDPTTRWWVDDLRLRRFVTPEPVATLRRTELAP